MNGIAQQAEEIDVMDFAAQECLSGRSVFTHSPASSIIADAVYCPPAYMRTKSYKVSTLVDVGLYCPVSLRCQTIFVFQSS